MDKQSQPPPTSDPGAFVPESTVAAAASPAPRPRQVASPLPETIGPYRILSLLGEGGMGSVYKAEQQNPHRLVALKVIRAGIVTDELIRRFDQEAEALGRLQHPGIAQVYEAGTADSGFGPQPYFAMEFIEGHPLVAYAAEQRLNVRARLELMAKVCDAVNHAHQRGIIHRDLKPGNILVDAHGQPKVLDFGVARVTDSDAQATRQTDIGQLIGTLAYMSPEQALANPSELDLRSDVYTLGVILYQLLADKLPYNTVEAAIHEVIRVIREEDPAPLSSIHRGYRGDIETIVAKALEKDRTRRYETAADLATDIRRHLRDEPIAAQPPSAGYQMQKFARRHKALVAGAAAVFMALLVGVIASTLEATRARSAERTALAAQGAATRERDRAVKAEQQATAAEQRAEQDRNRAQDSESKALRDRNLAQEQTKRANTAAATSKAVSDFLQYDLLNQASVQSQSEKGYKVDPNITVRTALDRAAGSVAGKFDKQPAVEAEIENTIGATYINLGLHAQAENHFARSIALARKALGDTDPNTLMYEGNYGADLINQRRYADADAFVSSTLDTVRRKLGDSDPKTLGFAAQLGFIYTAEDKYEQAEALLTKTIDTQRRVLGPEHHNTLTSMSRLAYIKFGLHDYASAEALLTQILEIQRRVRGPEHADTLAATEELARLYSAQKKFAQAEALFNQLIEIQRRTKGLEAPQTVDAMSSLAEVYAAEHKNAQAEELLAQTLPVSRRVLGDEHRETLAEMDSLARVYRVEGKYAQAEALLTQLLEIQRRVLGPESPQTLSAISRLAYDYFLEGNYAQAESLYSQGLEIGRRVLKPDDPLLLSILENLGSTLSHQGRYDEGEKLFREAIRNTAQAQLQTLWYNFACAAAVAGRKDDALEHLSQAIDLGFNQADYLGQDDDLKSLRGDPRFDAIVAKARQAAQGK